MNATEMGVVLTGLLLPSIVVLVVILFALYWVVRKAVRDGIVDVRCDVGQVSSSNRPV